MNSISTNSRFVQFISYCSLLIIVLLSSYSFSQSESNYDTIYVGKNGKLIKKTRNPHSK